MKIPQCVAIFRKDFGFFVHSKQHCCHENVQAMEFYSMSVSYKVYGKFVEKKVFARMSLGLKNARYDFDNHSL